MLHRMHYVEYVRSQDSSQFIFNRELFNTY